MTPNVQLTAEEVKEIVDMMDEIYFTDVFIAPRTTKSKWASDFCIEKINNKILEIKKLENCIDQLS